ncbi:MAG: histone deacetylase [Candidatus Eisenbacteria bacterium]|nr:histone deacetylase [Candidatus Eisenbacteria bacterium]
MPLPEGHPFPVAKYGMLRELLLREGVLAAQDVARSEPAPIEWLLAAHDPAYVERAFAGRFDAAEIRRLGLPWSEGLVARARASVHGTVLAARAALEHGVAGNLAGGTHHAFRDRGEAYCLFNDHAVAIALLRREGRVRRPFVVDLDVHQGNGTAALFAGDRDVFTYSLHARHNYPLRKEAGSLDVELPDGAGDDELLGALERTLPAALDRHAPDVAFYQAGVDALHADRLGRLRATHEGLAERDRRVFAWLESRGVPVVLTAGGGYGRPLEATVEAHANVWRAARLALGRRATPPR